jgi:hypothetical protein
LQAAQSIADDRLRHGALNTIAIKQAETGLTNEARIVLEQDFQLILSNKTWTPVARAQSLRQCATVQAELGLIREAAVTFTQTLTSLPSGSIFVYTTIESNRGLIAASAAARDQAIQAARNLGKDWMRADALCTIAEALARRDGLMLN